MRDYLVFQLYGPLAAWGDIAVGQTRPSDFVPSKSAILGLIGAALGLRRPGTLNDEHDRAHCEQVHQALAQGYGMAVKLTMPGLPLTDYHTAEIPKGTGFATRRDEILEVSRQKHLPVKFKGTVISRRDYRQDIFAGIALWARSGAPHPLQTLADRLARPEFPLYLGRKSCPLALPLNPVIRPADSMEVALAGCSFAEATKDVFTEQDAKWIGRQIDETTHAFSWDGDAETRLGSELRVTRRDLPTSRQRWQFTVREEHRAHRRDGESS